MSRYEISFIVNAPDGTDVETVSALPLWLFIGEDPMSPEWLEHIYISELFGDEKMFDFDKDGGINIVIEDRHEEKKYAVANQQQQKKEPPEWLKLVVDNDDQKDTQEDNSKAQE